MMPSSFIFSLACVVEADVHEHGEVIHPMLGGGGGGGVWRTRVE